ncbi:MAG: HAD family phosphatase [Acidimicrobiales bacterium]|jgi:epoxide hydrolase-like predicted phosphatase|nr:HAD family phosphatase [Acidimicrobiales bacterium]
MHSYEAVVFDFGGVFMSSPFEAIARLSEERGTDLTDTLHVVFGPYHEDTDHPWHRAERGELDLETARAHIRELGLERGMEIDLFDLLGHMGGDGTLRDQMISLTRVCRDAGLRTALLTNNIAEARDFWRPMLPLDELFDAVVDSSEVGMRKPDPRIYRHTVGLLGVLAEHAIFLDDYEGNVVAAEAVGMTGVLVESDPASAIARVLDLLDLPVFEPQD